MKIRHKLILGFLLVASLSSVTIFFTLRSYNNIDKAFARLMVDSTKTIEILNGLKQSAGRIISSTNEIGVIHDETDGLAEEDIAEEVRQLNESGYQEFETNLQRYEEMVRTIAPKDANTFEAIRATGHNLIETSHDLVELRRRHISGSQAAQKRREFEADEGVFLSYIDEALRKESGEQVEEQASVHEDISFGTRGSLVVAALTFVLALFSGLYISFLISSRIVKLKAASKRVGDGEFDTLINIDSNDEVGELSRDFNKMITHLKESRNEMISARRFTDSIVGSMASDLFVLDMDLNITRVNQTTINTFKFAESELVGQSINILRPDGRFFNDRNFEELKVKGSISGIESFLLSKHGTEIPILFSASIMRSTAGENYGIVCVAQDITDRKVLEEQLTHQALHDPLTKLANRVLFRDRVEHAINRAMRKKAPVAVMFLDLDNFKSVNDSLGHAAGDELLVSVTERLNACLRSSDTPARLGGDEFAILVEDMAQADEAVFIAERIRTVLQAPFIINGTEVFVGASIGIATTGNETQTPEELLRNADMAMYMSKSNGRDRYTVFEDKMHDVLVKRIQLETDMRSAIEKRQFEVYYQPIINLRSERIMGMEALVRWNHPEHGLIPPLDFIPVAEETGLIIPLGEWILGEACSQARDWQVEHDLGNSLSITVNIAGRQFHEDGLVECVWNALSRSKLPPRSLILEITESTMLLNTDATIKTLNALKELGVGLAIDDFGTGYSSLSYLQKFPVDILKIDKSFIDKIVSGKEAAAVAKAIITMGKTLHLKTIAEGIESVGQQDALQGLGCELGQGYHFARPLRAADMNEFLLNAATARRDGLSMVTPAKRGAPPREPVSA